MILLENLLILCRDRIGEKPLYYGWIENSFVFCSEIKALKKHPFFNNSISRNSLKLLTKYNYIPTPHSIYKDIYKLEPGKILTIKNKNLRKITFTNNFPISKDNLEIDNYWNLKEQINNKQSELIKDKEIAKKILEKKLIEVIKLQSFADVPVGAFLSGGIDSSLITSLMQLNSKNKINTFTIGSFDTNYNEAHFAKKIAEHLNTNHVELYIEASDALNIIPNISSMYDEPFADSSQLPTLIISQLTRKYVKVSLSGDGGDELFGGYNRYLKGPNLWNIINLLPKFSKKGISKILQRVSPNDYHKIELIINFFLSKNKKIHFLNTKMNRFSHRLAKINSRIDLFRSLISEWVTEEELVLNSEEPTNILNNSSLEFLNTFEEEMMYLDTLSYLPDDILTKVDRATMSYGLESRSPYLDHEIVEFSWNISKDLKIKNNIGKVILRDILYQYVPKSLLERPKQGFGIPLGNWLRGPLKEWANDLLNSNKLKSENYFNHNLVRNRFESHIQGENNWEHSLWSVLMFQSWKENFD